MDASDVANRLDEAMAWLMLLLSWLGLLVAGGVAFLVCRRVLDVMDRARNHRMEARRHHDRLPR